MMNLDRRERERNKREKEKQNQIPFHELKMTTSTWLSFNLVNEIKPPKQIVISKMLI
jgi:hypothetical protein